MLWIHIPLARANDTTFENPDSMLFGGSTIQKQSGSVSYDLGPWENWKQIFGSNYLLWFLPVFSSIGDGYSYPSFKEGKMT